MNQPTDSTQYTDLANDIAARAVELASAMRADEHVTGSVYAAISAFISDAQLLLSWTPDDRDLRTYHIFVDDDEYPVVVHAHSENEAVQKIGRAYPTARRITTWCVGSSVKA